MRSLMIFFAFSAVAVAQQSVSTSMNELSWLSGLWGIEQGERTGEEYWRPLINGRLEGKSTMKKNGKITLQEKMVIEKDSSGTVFYRVTSSGQKQVSFALVRSTPAMFIFENKKHDFPKRITYERISEDSLMARIEGMIKGKNQTVLFPFRRVIVNAD